MTADMRRFAHDCKCKHCIGFNYGKENLLGEKKNLHLFSLRTFERSFLQVVDFTCRCDMSQNDLTFLIKLKDL